MKGVSVQVMGTNEAERVKGTEDYGMKKHKENKLIEMFMWRFLSCYCIEDKVCFVIL